LFEVPPERFGLTPIYRNLSMKNDRKKRNSFFLAP